MVFSPSRASVHPAGLDVRIGQQRAQESHVCPHAEQGVAAQGQVQTVQRGPAVRTPGDHLRMLCEFGEPVEMLRCEVSGFVRMGTNRRVDPVVLLGERDCGVQPIGACAAADGEQRFDTRGAGAIEHRVAVFVEWRAFEVRV